MKEVLCIKKPGFYTKQGERYGPLYNEVCKVLYWRQGFISDGQLYYPQYVYYALEGYSSKHPDPKYAAEGFPFFLASYFVDLISDEQLAMELIGTSSYITPAPLVFPPPTPSHIK